MGRKRVPLNQNECTADFRIGVPFEQNLQADIINVSGTKNGMLDIKYRYNYNGDKYEESVRQSVGEIKVGDEKEIRIRKNAPEQIVTTSIKSAIMQNIAVVLFFFAYILASIALIEQIGRR